MPAKVPAEITFVIPIPILRRSDAIVLLSFRAIKYFLAINKRSGIIAIRAFVFIIANGNPVDLCDKLVFFDARVTFRG